MNRWLAIIISVMLVLLQICVTPMIKLWGLNCNFALVCIVVFSCLCGGKTAIFNAVLLSLIYDIYVSKVPGTYFLMYLILALLIQAVSKHMYNRNLWISLLFVVISTLISELLMYWIFYAFNSMAYNSLALSRIILPQCIINTLLCLPVFWLFKSVLKIKRV